MYMYKISFVKILELSENLIHQELGGINVYSKAFSVTRIYKYTNSHDVVMFVLPDSSSTKCTSTVGLS